MKNIHIPNRTFKELKQVKDELGIIHYGKTIGHLINSHNEHRTEMPKKNSRLKIKFLYNYGSIDSDWRNKALERAHHTSEISGSPRSSPSPYGSPSVHHIISVRKFLEKAIDFLFKDCFDFDLKSLFILDWDVVPDIIFEEMHHRHNLVILFESEHKEFEGMPRTFFHAVRRANRIGDAQ